MTDQSEDELQQKEAEGIGNADNAGQPLPLENRALTALNPDVQVSAPSAMPSTVGESLSGLDTRPFVAPSELRPAQGGAGPALVYTLGSVGYDLGTEARRDAVAQFMGGDGNPHDATQLLGHLQEHPYEAASVIWTLNLDVTPIYAIQPTGPFAAVAYERLREFMSAQLNGGVQRVSIPGYMAGDVRLMSGQEVPRIIPEVRGMYSWTTEDLVSAVLGPLPARASRQRTAQYEQRRAGIHNFLERVYYEVRNLGVSPQERAMNYAATNAFQAAQVFHQAAGSNMELDSINVEPSPVCRPGSDCWDVVLSFFNPAERLTQARRVHRFTIDVSDVVPVTIGAVRSWSVY